MQAALQLFVQYGFHGTPTSRIAQEAGVSNGTLFHYFKTKEDLVIALYNKVKNDLSQYLLIDVDPNASVKSLFHNLFTRSLLWALDNQQAFFYIQQFHFSPHLAQLPTEVLDEQTRGHRQLIERGLLEHTLKPLPANLIYALISSQVFGLYQYLISEPLTDAERLQVINQSANLTWDMLKA
ncbi:TetR/AcrR family transcriptional regulator [Spirosoma soli]|uniref:TetR/AcrR family transcriptional regulator n=1 Tax=Spirosoma soli TaxID=1770529 RepID=A0ABW5M0E8_9BACT